ncbi:hypothetical protein TARUN_5625 [Trichoderma arundinaceum]|uniref:Uncharacterized protein n=1 Tax=Trichoderma arundinaceum TaxID=490622 RepID=A0A395NKS7_TRIAR|nr:hypothetical protein TARUN_5625 [Trichoderma arundinaceum]
MATKKFVDSIIEAYGGQAYLTVDSITAKFQFTGAMLGLKGRPYSLLRPKVTVSTKEQRSAYRGLGGSPDEEWVFTPKRVWKQHADGTIIASRDNPRDAFKGHTLETPWDDFHFIYFCGYAMWQYLNFPFILGRDDIQLTELDTHHENGQEWRVVEATFPDADILVSHCKKQKFYFDSNLVLQRHDYGPDVLNFDTLSGSPAAHYNYDEVTVGGIKIPTLRRVVGINPADGLPLYHGPIPTLIHLELQNIQVKKQGVSTRQDDEWSLIEAPKGF